jgi:phage shock protein C
MKAMDGHKLTRSETNRRIAGVCGGLGEYFGIDPILIRLAFVLLVFMGGTGLLLYAVLWIVMPKGQPGVTPAAHPRARYSPALHIAEERFARGEISAEDLEQIRTDLTRSG